LRYTPLQEQQADTSLSKAAGHNANVARLHKNVAGMTHTGAGKPKQTKSITETRQTAVNLSNDPAQAVQKTIPVTRLCQHGRVTDCILHSGFRLTARSADPRSPQFPSDMSRGPSVLGQSIAVRAETESDGTRKRTGGEVKGKKANRGSSQQSCTVSDTVYPALLPLMRTPRLPADY